MQKQSPPSPPPPPRRWPAAPPKAAPAAPAIQLPTSHSAQDGDFAHAAEAIRQSVQDNPDLANLSHQLILEQTPEGLRIQLVDQDGRPMFQQGSAEPMPYTKKLLAAVGAIIDTPAQPGFDQRPHRRQGRQRSGGDWQISSARADAARAMLQAGGLSRDRIYEVAGKAGSEPLLPEDPNASANRRLSIVLLREAPPAPPGSMRFGKFDAFGFKRRFRLAPLLFCLLISGPGGQI